MGRYEVADLTEPIAPPTRERREIDPKEIALQLQDISESIAPALDAQRAAGAFGLDKIELALTIELEGRVWFIARGSAEASVTLTFTRDSAVG